jgi:hypothetical protein
MSLNCQRCGALLPEGEDEGICPVCGTPFGARTVAIAVAPGDLEAAHRAAVAARNARSVPPPPTLGSGAASGPPMALIVGLALLISALVLAAIAVTLLRGGA